MKLIVKDDMVSWENEDGTMISVKAKPFTERRKLEKNSKYHQYLRSSRAYDDLPSKKFSKFEKET